MKINKIKIENFYSYEKAELNFDNYSGLTFIVGKNYDIKGSNGSGKSAIKEAIVWAITGKTVRKSTEEAIVNSKAKKGTRVEILINDNVRIIRSKRPTFLEFFVGEKNLTKESVNATQEAIEEFLNTNYKVFMSSMVFGQDNDLDFISATPDEKRAIIKNFLNLGEVFDKREKIKELKSQYYTVAKEKNTLLVDYLAQHKDVLSKISSIETSSTKIIEGLGLSEDQLLTITPDNLFKKEAFINEALKTIKDKEKEIDATKSYLSELLLQISRGVYRKESKCPTCKKGVCVEKQTKKKLTDLRKLVKLGEDSIRVNTSVIASLNEEIRTFRLKYPITLSQYSKLESYRKELDNLSFYKSRDLELKSTIQTLEIEKANAIKYYDIMKYWETAFSEQGLVQYIIKNILDYFNNKCNEYLNLLTSGSYKVYFNEKLEEKIFISRRETKFVSLSGGERKKVNLAVLLALHSLLSLVDKEQSNMVFFDEVMDHLDSNSLSGLVLLFNHLKTTKKLFVISHDKELASSFEGTKVITVIKKNGTSYIKTK